MKRRKISREVLCTRTKNRERESTDERPIRETTGLRDGSTLYKCKSGSTGLLSEGSISDPSFIRGVKNHGYTKVTSDDVSSKSDIRDTDSSTLLFQALIIKVIHDS